MESFSLYFHIPFCQKKCPYCHFYSLKYSKELADNFFKVLELEWKSKLSCLSSKDKLVSIYFGGGTPSVVNTSYIEKVLSWIQKKFPLSDQEITLEINPSDATKEKIKDFFSMGINRLSLGVQTFDDALLSFLCRHTSSQEICKALDTIFEENFKNVSIDLLYELPKQTLSFFQKSLKTALKWPITHISLYNLVFEPHTLFYLRKKHFEKDLPSDTTSMDMLSDAIRILGSSGLERYEISAFAKKNFSSVHNLGYWTGRPFLGFGPSAFSYFSKKRSQNVCNLEKYIQSLNNKQSCTGFEEELVFPDNFIERLIIGLRWVEGVDLDRLEKEFSKKTPEDLWQKLKKLEEQKFVKISKNRIFLESKGQNFYDHLACDLL